jgi:predicted alpha/beta superfamily hydrolase
MFSFELLRPATQPGTEVRCLHSDIINQDLELYIKLPWQYELTETVYPVLFALDANRAFFLYSTMSLIYETPPTECDQVVIVGIGYEIDGNRTAGLAEWAAWRTRDLTPVQKTETDQFWQDRLSPLVEGHEVSVRSGGAGRFLAALCKEVIPFVEARYRVSSAQRGLAGYSYGGLFTLYALFHAPEAFGRVFAGSPTMWDELFAYEEEYAATHEDLEANLLITAGELESDLHVPIRRMVDRLRSRAYPRLTLQECMLEGEDHESGYAASVSRALRMLYGHGQASPT